MAGDKYGSHCSRMLRVILESELHYAGGYGHSKASSHTQKIPMWNNSMELRCEDCQYLKQYSAYLKHIRLTYIELSYFNFAK